nr:MAG TPA: hypothetical protein [Caudoviricetes sp.]
MINILGWLPASVMSTTMVIVTTIMHPTLVVFAPDFNSHND